MQKLQGEKKSNVALLSYVLGKLHMPFLEVILVRSLLDSSNADIYPAHRASAE